LTFFNCQGGHFPICSTLALGDNQTSLSIAKQIRSRESVQLRKSDANNAKGKTIRKARNVNFPYATLPFQELCSDSLSQGTTPLRHFHLALLNLLLDVQGEAPQIIHNQS
jgi:hypothetical protein